MNQPRYLIGIDPGVKTGVAVFDRKLKKLTAVKTMKILDAITFVECKVYDVEIWFEDARLRRWFGNSGREKLQGAGSIKRDCSIWQDLCEKIDAPYKAIPPKNNTTKTKADYFKRITGWDGKTSEHSRDAAMLVFKG